MADLTVTITLNDTQQAIMNNDLLDIKTWIEDAVSGKQNNCWKRMQTEWTSKLMNDESFTDPIPSNQADFVSLVTGRSDYQNRSERDSGEGERHGTN